MKANDRMWVVPFISFLISAVLLVSLPMAAGAAKNRKDSGDTVIVQMLQEPSSLNPYSDGQSSSPNICSAMYSTLFSYNEKWELQPELAHRIPAFGQGISKDGLQWKIQLRPKVKWHDGHSFTSADVKYTLDRVVLPRAGSVIFRGFEHISQVEAPDPQTVVIKLKEAWPELLDGLADVYILPSHLLEKYAEPPSAIMNRNPVGTGPYAFKEWKSGQIRLEAFENYFKGAPKIPQLVFKAIPDENAAVSQLTSGDLDIYSSVPLRLTKQVKALPNVKVTDTATPGFEHFAFNLSNPILADKRIRKAMASILPLDLIKAEVYQGAWKAASTISIGYAPKGSKIRSYPYDIDRAKRFLEEAGWKPGNDGIRTKGGKRLELTLSTTIGNRQREQVLEILRDEGRKCGIDFAVKNYPISSFLASKDHNGVVDNGNFDIALFAYIGGAEPEVYRMFHSEMVPPFGTNAALFRNPKADQMLETLNITTEPKKHQEIYEAFLELISDELPILPSFFWTRVDAYSERIKNVKPHGGAAGILWNVWEWSLEK